MQRGENLEECLKVNGGSSQREGRPADTTREMTESRPPPANLVGEGGSEVSRGSGEATSQSQPVDEETLGIVRNLLRERNPALAETLQEIVDTEASGEEEEDNDSSSSSSSEDDDEGARVVAAAAAKSPPSTSKLPKAFLCPITHEVMRDPVVLSDGHTYERSAINKWIKILGRTTSPMTGAPLTSTSLTPNFTLKSMIVERCFS